MFNKSAIISQQYRAAIVTQKGAPKSSKVNIDLQSGQANLEIKSSFVLKRKKFLDILGPTQAGDVLVIGYWVLWCTSNCLLAQQVSLGKVVLHA